MWLETRAEKEANEQTDLLILKTHFLLVPDETILGRQEEKEKERPEEGERFGSDDEEEKRSSRVITLRVSPTSISPWE